MAVDRQFPRNPLLGIACPSERLCVAGGSNGLYVSTVPTLSTWSFVIAPPAPPGRASVDQGSCPSVSFCAFPTHGRYVLISENPAGGPNAWKAVRTGAPTSGHFGTVSCASASLCVGVESGSGYVAASSNPGGGRAAWKVRRLREAADSVSCVKPSLCVITTQPGNVLTSTDPTNGRAPWRFRVVDAPALIRHAPISVEPVACASTHYCLHAFYTGIAQIGLSTQPTGGSRAWLGPVAAFPRAFLTSASCTATRFCAFAGNDGAVYTSTRAPTRRASWTTSRTDRTADRNAHISCPSSRFCAIVRDDGKLFIGHG